MIAVRFLALRTTGRERGGIRGVNRRKAPRTWAIENVVFVEFQPAQVPEIVGDSGCALTNEYIRIMKMLRAELRRSPHLAVEVQQSLLSSSGFSLSVRVCPGDRKLGTAVPFPTRRKDAETSPA
jgi:hypothetical protein